MMLRTHTLKSTLPIMLALVATACSDNSSRIPSGNAGDTNEEAYTQLTLDSDDSTAYLNLVTGEEVDETETWHLKANRLNIGLNTNVEGTLGDAQDEFYSDPDTPNVSIFTNASSENELNALYELTTAEGLSFMADELQYAISDWYNYNFMTHTVTPNTDSNWLIYSAEGNSYAKMTVDEIDQDGFEFTTTFNFDVQASGESSFSGSTTNSFEISNMAPKTCFDFDTGSTADCSGNTWDIGMDGGTLILNGGDSAPGTGTAKASGPIAAADLASYTAGTDIPLVAYSTDLLGGVFSDNTWYAYGLLGMHQIWPNYRVYVIDTDTSSDEDVLIKLQLINYYNDSGTSGFVTLRFMNLEDTGE